MLCSQLLLPWGEVDYSSFPTTTIELESVEMFLKNDVPDLESLDDSISSSSSSNSSLLTDFETICQTSTSSMQKKRVSFSKVEIREYAVVVGDHPLCEDGLPISLDWRHSESTVMDLESRHEVDSTGSKRFSSLRRLSYEDRVERLVSVSGMTTDEVIQAETNLLCQSVRDNWNEFSKDLTFSFDSIENHLRKITLAQIGRRHSST